MLVVEVLQINDISNNTIEKIQDMINRVKVCCESGATNHHGIKTKFYASTNMDNVQCLDNPRYIHQLKYRYLGLLIFYDFCNRVVYKDSVLASCPIRVVNLWLGTHVLPGWKQDKPCNVWIRQRNAVCCSMYLDKTHCIEKFSYLKLLSFVCIPVQLSLKSKTAICMIYGTKYISIFPLLTCMIKAPAGLKRDGITFVGRGPVDDRFNSFL